VFPAGKPIRFALLAAALALAVMAVAAPARMTTTELAGKLCYVEGGGRFVDIPNFPGEMIDRRLLRDIKYLKRNYEIFITDGYSTAPYHAKNGEHPIGLALDIVPKPGPEGSWKKITRLAKWAEPRQNFPREPFRWVGYNGDENHGRGDHLHLSWSHSETKPRREARWINTIQCPRKSDFKVRAGEARPNPPRDLAPVVPERDGTGAR
jgi:hypothetical protein